MTVNKWHGSLRLGRWMAALGALLLILPLEPAQAAANRYDMGALAPKLTGPDITGNTQDLDNYQGKWVFVDFWASWCNPCMSALPSVVALQDKLAARPDFAVLSVSLDDSTTREALENAAKSHRVSYPIVYEGDGWTSQIAQAWGVSAIPATFLVDPQGRVVASDISPDQAQRLIEQQPASNTAVASVSRTSVPSSNVNPSGLLLDTSPSTGRSSLRDFELSIPLTPGAPAIGRYQLYMEFALRGKDNALLSYGQRYNVTVTLDKRRAGVPYFIDIRDTSSGSGGPVLLSVKGGNGPLPNGTLKVPALSVKLDLNAALYQLNAPLPAGCVKVAYVLAKYDERLGDYTSDGLHDVPVE